MAAEAVPMRQGGKGRYVEENWGNPFSSGDDDSSYVQSIAQLSDGTLRAVISDSSDKGFSIKDSTDGGKTWTDSSMDLSALDQLKISSNTDDDGNGTYGYLGNISIERMEILLLSILQPHPVPRIM